MRGRDDAGGAIHLRWDRSAADVEAGHRVAPGDEGHIYIYRSIWTSAQLLHMHTGRRGVRGIVMTLAVAGCAIRLALSLAGRVVAPSVERTVPCANQLVSQGSAAMRQARKWCQRTGWPLLSNYIQYTHYAVAPARAK